MEYIKNYFKEKTKDITFIELKDDSHIQIRDYKVKEGTPLPLLTSVLIKEIKKGTLEEEIKITHIIDGIIYTLGVDQEFSFVNEYKSILKAYDKNIVDYIFYRGMKSLEDKDYDSCSINFRALLLLEPDNVKALFNYAIALEEIAKKLLQGEKTEEGKVFLNHSTKQLEAILDLKDDFSLAYYKLGFHYMYSEQYLKANLIWNKFLTLGNDDILLQEIREEMDKIKYDVELETGITYLAYNDFNKALDHLLKLIPKYEENWNINYLIGQAYNGLGQYEFAIDYFNKAIELNDKEPDIYNELGILFFNIGNIDKAIEVFSQGIDNCGEDYKLYFNRGLGYVQLEQLEDGLRDINRAAALNSEDINIKAQKESLEQILNNKNNN